MSNIFIPASRTKSNIYLDLELFLDPATTDTVALKAEINKKISNWHKMLNADPRNKNKVSKAKEYLAREFTNLQGQADTARTEKLQSLRNDIKKAGRVGGINEIKLKKLKSTHRAFFSESTIEKECGGTIASDALASKFTPPKCPDSLVCPKKISFKEMESLVEDLSLIAGQPKNLYELLKSSPTDNREGLSARAKDMSGRAIKMPKNNLQADPLNRLSGKCINYFKDDPNRKNYDIALKRFPFDNLCAEEFHWNIDDKDNPVQWDVYQESIIKTVQLGFTPDEAEWLVYEYYCITNKCPDPIPKVEKNASPTATVDKPKIDWVESVTKNAGQFFESVKNWYSKVQQARLTSTRPPESPPPAKPDPFTAPPPTITPAKVSIHGTIPKDLQKTLDGIRKKFSQQKKPSTIYLNGLFEELDSMFVQYQTSPAEVLRNLTILRAEVAEKLGDLVYAENRLVLSRQCYRAVLDSMPQHAKAGSRLRAIDSIKDDLFQRVRSTLAAKNFIACTKCLGSLKEKFSDDPETDNFIRKVGKQVLDIPVSKEYVQQLVNENRWYTLSNILEKAGQPSYNVVFLKAKKRVAEVDKSLPTIRRTLRAGRMEKMRQQFIQVKKFVSDHPELDAFQEEVKQFQNTIRSLDSEFKELINKGQLIKAENKLRQFLAEHPKYRQGLAGYAQLFANGVTHFQNGLRLGLFTTLGSLPFVVIFFVIFCGIYENGSNLKTEIVFAMGIGFLLSTVIYSLLIRFLYAFTKTSFRPGGFGLINTTILFVLASLMGWIAVVPEIVRSIVQHIISPDNSTMIDDFTFVVHVGACWFSFYILHVYIFSFFNWCQEDEKNQPLLLPWIVNTLFTVLFLVVEQNTVPMVLLFWGTVITLWGWTAFVAYLHLWNEIVGFPFVNMTDYRQRNSLLRQYKDTDFGQPLLLTDWYQKALDLAMQQTPQNSAPRVKN